MKKYELSIDNKALISVSLTVSGHFDIPRGIEAIIWAAFGNCELLESINIPNSVEEIDECAFEGCKSLKIITIENPHLYKKYINEFEDGFEGCKARVVPEFNIVDLVNEIDWF